jgi:hypothetical protein
MDGRNGGLVSPSSTPLLTPKESSDAGGGLDLAGEGDRRRPQAAQDEGRPPDDDTAPADRGRARAPAGGLRRPVTRRPAVLGSEGGQLQNANFGTDVWRPALRRLRLGGVTFHDLRHIAATMAWAGATTAELKARMGHSSSNAALRNQHPVP